MLKTVEHQYQELLETKRVQFGLMSGHAYLGDTKRLAFCLSRYKFVSKMMSGLDQVLEVGCADAFGSTIVMKEVKSLSACDFDPLFIEDAKVTHPFASEIEFFVHDMVTSAVRNCYDGVYFLDVLEHIQPQDEAKFMDNVLYGLTENGLCIAGMPSLESQAYASAISKAGHVNCKSGQEFRDMFKKYFHNVLMFSMNDEVLHTGFFPMSQYLFAIGIGKK